MSKLKLYHYILKFVLVSLVILSATFVVGVTVLPSQYYGNIVIEGRLAILGTEIKIFDGLVSR